LLLNAVIGIDVTLNRSTYLFAEQQEILKSVNTQATAKLSLKKNWNKKYYIIWSNLYTYTGSTRPALNNQSGQSNILNNFTSGLKQRAVISKIFSATVDTQLAYNNFSSPQASHFLFVDTELNGKLNKRLTVSLRGENLTDRKSYVVAYNGIASQSITTVPLIGRNFFVALHFEL
jgi:outer membrane receptor protein involved in Fe transport